MVSRAGNNPKSLSYDSDASYPLDVDIDDDNISGIATKDCSIQDGRTRVLLLLLFRQHPNQQENEKAP